MERFPLALCVSAILMLPSTLHSQSVSPKALAIESMKRASALRTETTCQLNGGSWREFGTSGNKKCMFRTQDNGTICSDTSECEGACTWSSQTKVLPPSRKYSAKKTTGVCSEWPVVPPCTGFVLGGVAYATCEAECRTHGGVWRSAGGMPRDGVTNMTCAFLTPDNGQPCLSNSQCEGYCAWSSTTQPGNKAVGVCSEWRYFSGCTGIVDGGIAKTICVD